MQGVNALRQWSERRFRNQHKVWLDGGGEWPLTWSLAPPTERQAAANLAEVRAWCNEWNTIGEIPRVDWEVRAWSFLGSQRLPVRILFAGPGEVASFLGEGEAWALAVERAALWSARWPTLLGASGWAYQILTTWSAIDFSRLVNLVAWLVDRPNPELWLRQLPVEGVDTKWIQDRQAVVLGLARRIDPRPERAGGFEGWAGLKRPSPKVRIRVLDAGLAQHLGGLTDLTAGADELRSLGWAPATVIIVENHATGTALPPLTGCVAIIGLGNGVSVVADWPWLRSARIVYWGDLDTWGLVILGRARASLGEIESFLMDEQTLLGCRTLWGEEPKQELDSLADSLTAEEADVLEGLRQDRWGTRIRLEQERIPWDLVVTALGEL